jgi:DNA-binding response OmpR family regulator
MSDVLEGKRVLIVDDEPDVLDIVEGLLPMCKVEKASSFGRAREILDTAPLDIAILDIMGVDGYKLLDIAKRKGIITVMLTAHALSVDDTIKSYKGGAASYVPKDKMAEIASFLRDVLQAKGEGKHSWRHWLDRLASYYERKFGPNWQDKDKDFWRNFPW